MIICPHEIVLPLQRHVSNNLALRQSADDLFDFMNRLTESKIIIDFTGIESITRSFAHQYILNKAESKKEILECNIPHEIKPMFELVKRQRVLA